MVSGTSPIAPRHRSHHASPPLYRHHPTWMLEPTTAGMACITNDHGKVNSPMQQYFRPSSNELLRCWKFHSTSSSFPSTREPQLQALLPLDQARRKGLRNGLKLLVSSSLASLTFLLLLFASHPFSRLRRGSCCLSL